MEGAEIAGTRRVFMSMTKRTRKRTRPPTVSTSTLKKSAAAMAPQCAFRNVFQGIVFPRRGAGSIPCSLRIRCIVERPRGRPRFSSAPRRRVYPQDGFSRAIVTSCRTLSTRFGARLPALRLWLPSYFAATLAIPAKDGLWPRERGDLREQSSPERLPLFGEKPALRIGEPKAAWAETRPQHAILSRQELDRIALAATNPAAEQQNEKLERRRKRHGRAR
jgi:hypothetical protein